MLRGFNYISQQVIREVEKRARQQGDAPVLVIVNGTDSGDDMVRWRAMGSLMAMTSPFLDSDMVVAWDYGAHGVREKIVSRFPGRITIPQPAAAK